MKKLNIKMSTIAVLVIIAIGIISSCKKDSLLNNSKTIDDKPNYQALTSSNPPSVVNGILNFSSEDQYNSYIDYLGQITTCEETDSCEADVDDVLQVEEDALGFDSYRQVFQALTDIEFNSPTDVPNAKFIDPILQSILTPEFDVIINGEYYNMAVDGFEVNLHSTDFDKITAIRNYITAGYDIVNIENQLVADENAEWGDIEVNRPSYKKAHTDYSEVNGYMRINVKNVFQGEGCEAGEVCLYKIGMYSPGGNPNTSFSYPGTITIDWGDGSAVQTFTNSGALSGYNKTSTCHPYAVGTYTITVTGTPTNTSLGSLAVNIPITVAATSCGAGVSKNASQWNYPTTDRAMKCELDARNSGWSRKVVATTTAYKKKSNGKWVKYKADRVVAQLGGAVTDATCGNSQNVVGASWPYNSKEAKADDVIGYLYGYFSITSNHKIKINGTYYDQNLEINGCE